MKEEKNPRPTPRVAAVAERVFRAALRGMQRKNDVKKPVKDRKKPEREKTAGPRERT